MRVQLANDLLHFHGADIISQKKNIQGFATNKYFSSCVLKCTCESGTLGHGPLPLKPGVAEAKHPVTLDVVAPDAEVPGQGYAAARSNAATGYGMASDGQGLQVVGTPAHATVVAAAGSAVVNFGHVFDEGCPVGAAPGGSPFYPLGRRRHVQIGICKRTMLDKYTQKYKCETSNVLT